MDTSDSFRVVRWYDPEVERHCDLQSILAYRTGRDLDELDLPEDAKPIVFHCRLLTRDQRRQIRSIASEYVQREGAFQYGVTSIENLPRNGRLETVVPSRRGKRDPIDDPELDRLGLGDDDIQEVGEVILAKSTLGKGVPLRCEVLDSSRRAWVSVASSLRAEQKTDSETSEAGTSQ